MRFFIGAVVSTLILSPVSVLSMALNTPSSGLMTQDKVHDGTIQRQYPVASTLAESSLQKRCIGKCSRKHKSEYQCKKKFFSSYQIQKAKHAACLKIKANKQKNAFPSPHTALKFDVPGPYQEWPIKRNGRFWNKWSKNKYRIVLNHHCEVAGAVVRHNDSSYTKCTHLDDGEDDDEDDE